MKELKTIDFNKEKYFECQGKKYYVTDTLSFGRYKELQKLSLEFGYSATFTDIFNNLKRSLDSFNSHKYDEMVVIIHNIMNGITKIETKDDPALRICALFILEEGEDPTTYNEGHASSKIAAWGKEYEVSPFFYLAASLVENWMPAYEMQIRDGSKTEAKLNIE